MRVSPGSAHNRIDTARRLHGLPAVVDLVETGHVSVFTGKLIAAHLRYVRAASAEAITRVVADRIHGRAKVGLRPWGWKDIRLLLNQLVAALPDEDRLISRSAAKADRRVWVSEQPDGMATFSTTVTDVDATRIYQRLTAIANGLDGDDDPRTLDQKRADVFVDTLLAAGRTPDTATGDAGADSGGRASDGVEDGPAGRQGPGWGGEVNVVIPLATLLGLADDPGNLAGLGPIPADMARELAADRKWRAWITDTINGQVTATSPTTYRPTAAVQRLVRAREPYCRYPGCRRTATRTDLDHTLEFPEGLSTPANLGPLCRRHHILKTHHNYDLTGPPDDEDGSRGGGCSWTWTLPTGITLHDEPEPPLG